MTAYLHRSSPWLVGGFAGTALLLGIVGLYGVISYSVSQRTREIGVRIALGAEHGAVWLAMLGIGLGGAGSVAGAIFARKLLFGVSSWDLQSLFLVPAVLTCGCSGELCTGATSGIGESGRCVACRVVGAR